MSSAPLQVGVDIDFDGKPPIPYHKNPLRHKVDSNDALNSIAFYTEPTRGYTCSFFDLDGNSIPKDSFEAGFLRNDGYKFCDYHVEINQMTKPNTFKIWPRISLWNKTRGFRTRILGFLPNFSGK